MSINNLDFMYRRLFKPGVDPERIKQKVCQDIFITKLCTNKKLISKVVFKGGIVMYELTSGQRGHTKDIDIDFIRYPITPEGVETFIKELNTTKIYSNIDMRILSTKILNQVDYKGTRAELVFSDSQSKFNLTIDVGVHINNESIPEKIDYEFKLTGDKKKIPIDANEISIYEKLSTFAKFATDNERIHDLFDLFWRLKYVKLNTDKLLELLDLRLVYSGVFKNRSILKNRLIKTFNDGNYRKEMKLEDNWTGCSVDSICDYVTEYIKKSF